MTKSSPIKVAVVGGGVIGASTAQQLARAGADVILLTETALASCASGRSLSWLNSAGTWSEPYHRLRMVGIDRYRTLSAQQPGLRWLRFAGGLAWYADNTDEVLRRRHEHAVAHGYDSHLLARDEISARTPGVNSAVIPDGGAIWNPGEGWVDLPSLVQFLIKDFAGTGWAARHQCREVHPPNPCQLGNGCGNRRRGAYCGRRCGLGDRCRGAGHGC